MEGGEELGQCLGVVPAWDFGSRLASSYMWWCGNTNLLAGESTGEFPFVSLRAALWKDGGVLSDAHTNSCWFLPPWSLGSMSSWSLFMYAGAWGPPQEGNLCSMPGSRWPGAWEVSMGGDRMPRLSVALVGGGGGSSIDLLQAMSRWGSVFIEALTLVLVLVILALSLARTASTA